LQDSIVLPIDVEKLTHEVTYTPTKVSNAITVPLNRKGSRGSCGSRKEWRPVKKTQTCPAGCSLIRSDFTITCALKNSFIMESVLNDTTRGGMVRCTFTANHSHKESMIMCEGANKMLHLPNAGGNSLWSEVISLEVLACMFNAKLLKTEMELQYWPLGCKITDYSVELFNQTIGVSVTRALKFAGTFGKEDARNLLEKKLYGVNVSSKCVLKEHAWTKQVMFIWAEQHYVADVIESVYQSISDELKSNTLIFVVVSQNAKWLY